MEFKFNYLSDNGVLLYFLDFYAKNSGLKYSIHQNANEISLFIDEENEDKILKFGRSRRMFVGRQVKIS